MSCGDDLMPTLSLFSVVNARQLVVTCEREPSVFSSVQESPVFAKTQLGLVLLVVLHLKDMRREWLTPNGSHSCLPFYCNVTDFRQSITIVWSHQKHLLTQFSRMQGVVLGVWRRQTIKHQPTIKRSKTSKLIGLSNVKISGRCGECRLVRPISF